MCQGITWVGVFGIQDPLRKGVSESMGKLKAASIAVVMVTGDSMETAKAVAAQCGILEDGMVMDGAEFRSMSPQARSFDLEWMRPREITVEFNAPRGGGQASWR